MVRDRPGRTNRTSAERIYFALRGRVYKVRFGRCKLPYFIEKQSGLVKLKRPDRQSSTQR